MKLVTTRCVGVMDKYYVLFLALYRVTVFDKQQNAHDTAPYVCDTSVALC